MEKSLTVFEVNFSRYWGGDSRYLRRESLQVYGRESQGDMDRNHHKKKLGYIFFTHEMFWNPCCIFQQHVSSNQTNSYLREVECLCLVYAVHPESPTGFDRCCTRESIFHIEKFDSNIYPITQSLMWKKTEVVFYFQSCYLPTWIANGIPNKTWTDFAFVVGVFFLDCV